MKTAPQNIEVNPSAWVEEHADYLFNYAIVRVSKPEVAEDIIQDTFLSALKALNDFKGGSSERTWLTAILKRKIIDYYRKNARYKEDNIIDEGFRFEPSGDYKGHWIEKYAPSIWDKNKEQIIENEELMTVLQLCISLLPQKWAAIFVLKVLEELKTENVCKEMDITSSNLWVIIHRCKLQLRDCLEEKWFNT